MREGIKALSAGLRWDPTPTALRLVGPLVQVQKQKIGTLNALIEFAELDAHNWKKMAVQGFEPPNPLSP